MTRSAPRRSRLAALTCAAVVALAAPGLSAAGAADLGVLSALEPAGGHSGLSRLLTSGTPTGRGIATFDAVPTSVQVQALKALGLTVLPMRHLSSPVR